MLQHLDSLTTQSVNAETLSVASNNLPQVVDTIFVSMGSDSGNDIIALVSTIAAAISALAALFTIWIAVRNQREEREQRKPYFIIEKPGLKPLPENDIRIQITFINKGIHPAKGFNGKILMIHSDLDKDNEQKIKFDVVNDIPSESPTPWYSDGVKVPINLPMQYIYCKIKYEDPILKKNFSQEFYMRWDGVQNGTTHPDFVHASKEEKETIISYLKQEAT